MMMHETKNDLPEQTRLKCIFILQERLADAIDVMLQVKQAHWNVKGLSFIALHKLFDKVHEDVRESVDLIAERIAQLGGIAEGTLQSVFERSNMPIYPLNLSSGMEHVQVLSSTLATFTRVVREAIDQFDQLRDKNTADIFTEISRDVDKDLWMVEAHLQGPETISTSLAA
jgi:starvation-inducible DNA-binding protein